MTRKGKIITTAAIFGILALAGTAAAYYKDDLFAQDKPVAAKEKPLPWKESKQNPPPQQMAQQQPKCDDKNIVGTVAGGVAGGVVGNQIGGGKGKTAATIGGVIGGAVLGNQYIPTRNVTCQQ